MGIQRKTLKNGKPRFIARYRDHTGKEHSRSFPKEAEAKAFLQDQERAVRRNEWVEPTAATVYELVEEHWKQARNPSTKAGRKALLNNLGSLGGLPVQQVKPSDVAMWMGQLTEGRPWADGKTLAASSAQTLAAILHGVLTKAVNDDTLTRHPMRGIKIRRVNVTVHRDDIPTAVEVKALIDAANTTHVGRAADPMMACIIQVAAQTGLRAGEICGLRVRNVNALRGEIRVVEQIAERTGEFAALKTESSHRVVPVLPETIAVIEGQLARCPRKPNETVFARSSGAPLTSGQVGARFRKVARVAGVDTTFHALRHFYASALLDRGVPVKVVQGLLGHSSAVMTLNVYSHIMPSADAAVRDALGFLRDFCGISGVSDSGFGSVSTGQGML